MDPWWQGRQAAQVRFSSDGTVTPLANGIDRRVNLRWKFTKASAVPNAPTRKFIQIEVDNKPVPKYHVSRHSNWGFIMQSCWAVYSSFEMPQQGADDPEMKDEHLAVTVETQRAEVIQYNLGQHAEDAGDDVAENNEESVEHIQPTAIRVGGRIVILTTDILTTDILEQLRRAEVLDDNLMDILSSSTIQQEEESNAASPPDYNMKG